MPFLLRATPRLDLAGWTLRSEVNHDGDRAFGRHTRPDPERYEYRNVLASHPPSGQSGAMVAEAEWEPWLLISNSGLWLGLAVDCWVVGRLGGQVAVVDSDARALLPLLERDWAVVQLEVEDVGQRALDLGPLPLTPTVALALSSSVSRHWTAAALRWLLDGFPISDLGDREAELVHDTTVPQSSRHAAAKILKANQ